LREHPGLLLRPPLPLARDHFRGAEGATHGLVVAAVEVAAELQDVIAGALP
jgi:hypothetical protein